MSSHSINILYIYIYIYINDGTMMSCSLLLSEYKYIHPI